MHEIKGSDRLLRIEEVEQYVAFSRRKVWRDVAAMRFPKPIKLGSRTTRWRLSEIMQFIRGEWKGAMP